MEKAMARGICGKGMVTIDCWNGPNGFFDHFGLDLKKQIDLVCFAC